MGHSQIESPLEQLLHSVPLGIAQQNPMSGLLTFSNKEFSFVTGYTNQELQHKSFEDLTPPHEYEHERSLLNELIKNERKSYQLEKHYIRKDGSLIWVDVTCSILSVEAGKPSAVIALVNQFADPRKNTQFISPQGRTAKALEISNVGIFTYLPQSEQIHWSEPSNLIFGYPPGTLSVTMDDLMQRIDSNDQTRVKTAMKESLDTMSKYQEEFRIIYPDGSIRWILAKGGAIFEANGMKCISGVHTDSTVRKKIENERLELISNLDSEKHLRNQFMNALTHDLRTPLSTIKMSSQLISRNSKDTLNVEKFSKRILQNVNRTDRMIQDLLDASRVQAGKGVPIHIVSCNLESKMKECLDDLEIIYPGRFQFQVIGEKFDGFWCPNSLIRMVENLCSNAIKYGSAGSVSIKLKSKTTGVVIAIQNYGPVLSEKEQSSLFAMFHRTKSAASGRQTGWGIGLAIVKGVTEAHRGQIDLTSTQSEGTTFEIFLPWDARNTVPPDKKEYQ